MILDGPGDQRGLWLAPGSGGPVDRHLSFSNSGVAVGEGVSSSAVGLVDSVVLQMADRDVVRTTRIGEDPRGIVQMRQLGTHAASYVFAGTFWGQLQLDEAIRIQSGRGGFAPSALVYGTSSDGDSSSVRWLTEVAQPDAEVLGALATSDGYLLGMTYPVPRGLQLNVDVNRVAALVRLDKDGAVQWAQPVVVGGATSNMSLAYDEVLGKATVAGTTRSVVDDSGRSVLVRGPSMKPSPASAGSTAWVFQFSDEGQIAWSHLITHANNSYADTAVAVSGDAGGEVALSGSVSGDGVLAGQALAADGAQMASFLVILGHAGTVEHASVLLPSVPYEYRWSEGLATVDSGLLWLQAEEDAHLWPVEEARPPAPMRLLASRVSVGGDLLCSTSLMGAFRDGPPALSTLLLDVSRVVQLDSRVAILGSSTEIVRFDTDDGQVEHTFDGWGAWEMMLSP